MRSTSSTSSQATVLGWYDEIVAAVDRVSVGQEIGPAARTAMEALDRHVGRTIGSGSGMLPDATATLAPAEVVSNAAVMMFGGIETSEGMTTSLFWHLLTDPEQLAAVAGRPRRSPATPSTSRCGSSRRPGGSTGTRRPTRSSPAPRSGAAIS